jgi:hypothetical protein
MRAGYTGISLKMQNENVRCGVSGDALCGGARFAVTTLQKKHWQSGQKLT